jgi:hypothetical protein
MVKKSNIQVSNDKNVLASILNLGAILKYHACVSVRKLSKLFFEKNLVPHYL